MNLHKYVTVGSPLGSLKKKVKKFQKRLQKVVVINLTWYLQLAGKVCLFAGVHVVGRTDSCDSPVDVSMRQTPNT